MVKAPLVTPDATFGEELLRSLDDRRFPISVAAWLKQDDEEWELLLATSLYDKLGVKDAYARLLDALSEESPVALNSLPIRLTGHKDPVIKDLRRLFKKTASVDGLRIGGQRIGDRWIEDGYLYRVK